ISVYVLVAIVKKTLNLDQSLYTILQILSLTLFEKEQIYQALSNVSYTNQEDQLSNQSNLFD
ncbi:MAG: IS4 family transposase, partial [Deltaproteobacteria bacterium]|nr:IS4 family transposase [Deltaproteobacteria bacterium]